jgi:hypothetical protein
VVIAITAERANLFFNNFFIFITSSFNKIVVVLSTTLLKPYAKAFL